MTVRIGINGFGRIGRNTFRIIMEREDIEVVAVNDITDPATLAHLLQYDSLYGALPYPVRLRGEKEIEVGGHRLAVFAERDPEAVPWAKTGAEIVVEATGKFRAHRDASRHFVGGAERVLVTAPVNDADITVVMGVNEEVYDPERHRVISNASCTTNALAPLAKILHENFGVVKGLMNTTHSYTNDQRLLDLPHPDLRRARAAGLSQIPTSTGAAKTVGKVIPELEGRIDGFAVRVPTPTVSLVDFVAELEQEVTVAEVNGAFKDGASRLEGILGYSEDPLVSSDYLGNSHSSTVDALSTMVVGGNMVRVVGWYDNEWGYSNRVADLAYYMARGRRAEKKPVLAGKMRGKVE